MGYTDVPTTHAIHLRANQINSKQVTLTYHTQPKIKKKTPKKEPTAEPKNCWANKRSFI